MLDQSALALIWFLLLGVLLGGYAVLDGFDLGVGILHPFAAKSGQERTTAVNSIGPLWDGNEVWLVVFGGAMFAMFPELYAAVFSGFYLPLMGLLVCLILRAVSIDFRGKVRQRAWKRVWDWGFFLGSAGATLLFGVAVGNILRGVPLNADGLIRQTLPEQLNPFSLLVGLLALALFAVHGGLYLSLKTEGRLQEQALRCAWLAYGLLIILYLAATIFVFRQYQYALRNFELNPILWLIPGFHVLALANIPRSLYRRRLGPAFLSSSAGILFLVALLGISLFPYTLYDPANPEFSLSYLSAASSGATLGIGLLFVCLGLPFVAGYTFLVYRAFWGKASSLDEY
jgi:cytochrome bd ubiquinol oxidase subunit II